MVEIATSILRIQQEEAMRKFYDLEVAHTDYFHIDVMDGKFVEKDTREIMATYATSIKHISNIPLDVHLMVEDVKEVAKEYLSLDPNCITFHYEALPNQKERMELIQWLKENNTKVGMSVKPSTKVEEIFEYLPYLHRVLIMTVEPGKGGQTLLPETIQKIERLKEYRNKQSLEIDIEADGGITKENIGRLVVAGIDIAVVGSAITEKEDFKKEIEELKNVRKDYSLKIQED